MTAPIWMAAPPEVHSALLSSGPGPGPLLASAAAWTSLSIEYAEAADELTALVSAARAGAWSGPTAQAYVVAHAPYLTWLMQASADGAATAAQQQIAAAAYTAALAAMPTLGELAANHAVHAVLAATNFFGLNTIPIAVNEADYARMWMQAATVMSAYQGAAAAAVTASPRSAAAPAIVKGDPAAAASDPFSFLTDFFAAVEKVFNSVGGDAGGDLFSYIFSVPPGTDPLTWFVTKFADLSSSTGGYPALMQGLVSAAGDNPVLIAAAYMFGGAAIGYDLTIQVIQFSVTFPLLAVGLAAPLLALPAALGGFGAGGVVGIAEIHAHMDAGMESVPDEPIAALSPTPTSVSGPAAPAAAPTAPAVGPAPSVSAPAFGAPAAPAAPPTPPGQPAGPFPYLMGATTNMPARTSARASVKSKASRPEIAAAPAAAAASAKKKARSRRQRRDTVQEKGRGYEYLDLDDDPGAAPPDPATVASHRGAGPLGFAGTTQREAEAAGLTTLIGDAFGGGPKEPMMPSTWAVED